MNSYTVRLVPEHPEKGSPFQGGQEEITVESGTLLDRVLMDCGLIPDRICGGNGVCGRCRVWIRTESKETFKAVLACKIPVDCNMEVKVPDRFIPQVTDETVRSLPQANPSVMRSKMTDSLRHESLGVAVDLGTTTIVFSLYDLQTKQKLGTFSRRNPQSIYGADVIARIQYAIQGPEQTAELQRKVIQTISEALFDLTAPIYASPAQVKKIVVAGNSVMSFLFCGIDVSPLAKFPFQPPIRYFNPFRVSEDFFPQCPEATVYVFPLFAGFVGGDIVAGVLAQTHNYKPQGPELLVDLGTNGEMALIHNGRILVAATAAGPAFEGGNIRFGMLALPGAVDAFDFSKRSYWNPDVDATLPYKTIGQFVPRGICGSGLVDLTAELLRYGFADPGGRIQQPRQLDTQISLWPLDSLVDRFEDQKAFCIEREENVWLTQKDIRQVQLAVGAIRAGVRLLLQKAEVSFEQLDRLYLAGMFGNVLNMANAKRIGLLPNEVPNEKIDYIGNSSLTGATLALLDDSCWDEAHVMIDRVEHVDLAALDNFQEAYVESMIFPES